MKTKTAVATIAGLVVLAALAACNKEANPVDAADTTDAGTTPVTTTMIKYTAAEILAGNQATHEAESDYAWDASQETRVSLAGSSITTSSTTVTVNGSVATIGSSGTYRLTGSLTDGQVLVNSSDQGTVRLILDGVTMRNSTGAPLAILKAKKAVVILADDTQNTLTDAVTYVFPAGEDEPNAALFSKTDMTIAGNGSLTVNGNYNDAIASKDGLVIRNGTIVANAVDDGIRGKDYLVVREGTITVNSGGDALKSDNDEDAPRGYILIASGTIDVQAGGDGITAETDAVVTGGTLSFTTGGGSSHIVTGDASAKGIKGLTSVVIDDGTFTINSADDAIHSNARISINGGNLALSSGDDGIHADSTLGINGGEITISKCYEGLESVALAISNGTIRISASDDGINGAGGNDGSGRPGWPGGTPGNAGRSLSIGGGYIAVTAQGDGLDVNGSIAMSGGTVIVHGPTAQDNGAIDYDASFRMGGGTLVAAGSAGMAQAPSAMSGQCAILVTFGSTKPAGTLFRIQSSTGVDIVTFQPMKAYQSVAVSSPALVKGTSYEVYVGGASTGTNNDGLYSGGTFSGGTRAGTITFSSAVTNIRL